MVIRHGDYQYANSGRLGPICVPSGQVACNLVAGCVEVKPYARGWSNIVSIVLEAVSDPDQAVLAVQIATGRALGL